MARGDLVSGILTASGNYQPAAGVEVVITFVSVTGASDVWDLYDGTNAAPILAASMASPAGIRVPVTNTRYLRYTLGTNKGGYGGIQTK